MKWQRNVSAYRIIFGRWLQATSSKLEYYFGIQSDEHARMIVTGTTKKKQICTEKCNLQFNLRTGIGIPSHKACRSGKLHRNHVRHTYCSGAKRVKKNWDRIEVVCVTCVHMWLEHTAKARFSSFVCQFDFGSLLYHLHASRRCDPTLYNLYSRNWITPCHMHIAHASL